MTNEEFYELARKNNAIMTPEESEKCRQETKKFFERYQLNFDWLGSPYFTDTHNLLHVFLINVIPEYVFWFDFIYFLGYHLCSDYYCRHFDPSRLRLLTNNRRTKSS